MPTVAGQGLLRTLVASPNGVFAAFAMIGSGSERKRGIPMNLARRLLSAVLIAAFSVSVALAQGDRVFSVPLHHLKTWSEKVIVPLNVEITGNSKVHKVEADCEMHFGAKAPAYDGDPPGLVLEPMNLCITPFPGKSTQSNKDWENFGKSLKGAKVRAEGVPRIWPEHLVGGGDSNPNHALELHPMTQLQRGNQVFDFTSYIYVPAGFEGGVGHETARRILSDTEVSVTEKDGMVDINFDSGRIGNFTTLQISVTSESIVEVDGSHRMNGQVNLGRKQKVPVRLVTVAGTKINKTIAQLKGEKGRKATFDALVLFSLSPEALYKAAQESHGQEVSVQDPLQLIVYGQPDSED